MDVTIITAFYHGEKYIQGLLSMISHNAIDCKKKGLHLNIEYLIVNDSPEINLNIVNPYEDNFALKIISNPCNLGIHQTRVNGLNHATGEFVIILDQDDVLLPSAISSGILKIGNADIVIGNGYITEGQTKRPIYKTKIAQKMATKGIFYAFCTSMCVSPGHVLLRRSSIPDTWKKNIMLNNGSDDYFLWLLMIDRRAKFVMNKEKVYEHIGTNENFSLDRKKMYESSKSFCEIAVKEKLLNQDLLNRIVRRTKIKMEWNFSPKKEIRIILLLTNLDIILLNAIYKIFY